MFYIYDIYDVKYVVILYCIIDILSWNEKTIEKIVSTLEVLLIKPDKTKRIEKKK